MRPMVSAPAEEGLLEGSTMVVRTVDECSSSVAIVSILEYVIVFRSDRTRMVLGAGHARRIAATNYLCMAPGTACIDSPLTGHTCSRFYDSETPERLHLSRPDTQREQRTEIHVIGAVCTRSTRPEYTLFPSHPERLG